MKCVLKEMLLGPMREVVVNGFPRSIANGQVGPLASRAQNVDDAIKNVMKLEGPRSTR